MIAPLSRFVPLEIRIASRGLRRRFTPRGGPSGRTRWAGLFERFESLGDDCEFAALQRAHGVDRAALFNWRDSNVPLLVHALHNGLEGFDQLDKLSVDLEDSPIKNVREYVIVNSLLGSRAHTFFLETECSARQVLEHEHRSLVLLKRKFLSDVARARRIYVYRASTPIAKCGAEDLARALQLCGDNILLWVASADDAHAAGEVAQLGRGLYQGRVRSITAEEFGELEKGASWIAVLHNVLAMIDCQTEALLEPAL
jgi:hypothetical protein